MPKTVEGVSSLQISEILLKILLLNKDNDMKQLKDSLDKTMPTYYIHEYIFCISSNRLVVPTYTLRCQRSHLLPVTYICTKRTYPFFTHTFNVYEAPKEMKRMNSISSCTSTCCCLRSQGLKLSYEVCFAASFHKKKYS